MNGRLCEGAHHTDLFNIKIFLPLLQLLLLLLLLL